MTVKRTEWVWEILDEFTKRIKVIGGWIVLNGSHTNKGSISESMCFVVDRDHEWMIIPTKVAEKLDPITAKLLG